MTGLPDRMTAIVVETPGGPDVLQPKSVPTPKPAHGDVLIRVAAAGLNRADLSQRSGTYGARSPTPKPPGVLGLEVSGVVATVGEGVTGWKVGDTVCALINGGGYAEFAVAPAAQCLPVPNGVTLVDAGGLPEACITVWLNVFDLCRLQPGEWLLVHGGTSGIGTIAIQMARALGSSVIATAGTPEKCRRCEELGADRGVDYRTEDFVKAVHDTTGGAGVDVILEMVGGDYLERGVRAMAPGGRLAIIALRKGAKVEFDFSAVQAKDAVITGSRLMPRSPVEKARLVAAVRKSVWPQIEARRIRPVVDRTFALREASQAHAYMDSGKHVGKILLTTG